MKTVEVKQIIDPIPASDGAGVKLKRSIGVEPNYFDPFLMLDEFGSENSEDYIAGFPSILRGIETVTYMLMILNIKIVLWRRKNDCWRCSVDENRKWNYSFRNACHERRQTSWLSIMD